MQEILIDKIRTDGGVQSRERINEEYVSELAEMVKAGKRLPPCEVYNDGTAVWMADGFHRLHAHVRAGKRTVRCEVHKGTQADTVWASCGANLAHGLRRTNADKRHAVELALKTKPELSDQAIADHAGVSLNFVTSMRRQLPHDGGVDSQEPQQNRGFPPPPTSRVGVDGRTRRLPLPPPSGAPRRVLPPPPGQTASSRPPPPSSPAKAPVRTDAVGKPIPDHLMPLFDRAPEVQALLGQLSSVKGVLNRADADGDVLFGDCNMQSALAGIQQAYDVIKATTPYAVCPWCHGTLSDECRGCGHRGVLGKYRWDTTVPRELKT